MADPLSPPDLPPVPAPVEAPSPFLRLRLKRLIFWPLGVLVVLTIAALIPPASDFGAGVTAVFLATYATLLLAAVSACRVAGIPLTAVIGTLPQESRGWLRAGMLGPLVLAFSAASMWATVYAASGVSPDWAGQQLAGDDDPTVLIDRLSTTQRYLLALLAVVIAPVVEEFAFRGLLMRRSMARRGFWPGLLLSALVFAVLHPPNWIGAFVFSVVAGILYLWSGSLALPILVHMINNGFVALTLLAQQFAPTEPPTPSMEEFRAQWIGPLLLLLAIAAMLFALTRPLVAVARQRAETKRSAHSVQL